MPSAPTCQPFGRAKTRFTARTDRLRLNEMTALDASSVAALLREFGQRSALRGGNPFRAKAYARAADNLLALSLRSPCAILSLVGGT